MKKLLTVLVGALALTSLVGSPAGAGHSGAGKTKGTHYTPPTNLPIPNPLEIKAACTVDGDVTIGDGVTPGGGGVSDVPAHNHYAFVGTSINCTGTPGHEDQGGDYDVAATGGTDGPYQPCVLQNCDGLGVPGVATVAHGETCAVGWSAGGSKPGSPTPDGASDTFTVSRPGKATGLGAWVKFVRVGSAVVAWGYLPWTDKKHDHFIALLAFNPVVDDIPKCTPAVDGKITSATLTGAAVTFNSVISLPSVVTTKPGPQL